MRYFQEILGSESAAARAHPDSTRDVWEMAVWDPFPATLNIFCLFSPGHVFLYMLFLPLTMDDPRPKMTVFKCLLMQLVLSAQLFLFQSRFSQQAKDAAIIQREVLHEYDVKYVHPQLHPVYREAATQIVSGEDGILYESVNVGTPTTLIRRGFKTNPNPNYAKYYDPDNLSRPHTRNVISPGMFTPVNRPTAQPAQSRPSLPSPTPSFQHYADGAQAGPTRISTPPTYKSSQSYASGSNSAINFGGNLGVYSHRNSPLKKAMSMDEMGVASPRNSREMAALEQRELAERMVRQSSPSKTNHKRATTQSGAGTAEEVREHKPAPYLLSRPRLTQERFPSRR